MAESASGPAPPFELSLTGDRRFHRIVGELYARAAEQLGYSAVDAIEIGRSIETAVLGVMEHGYPDHTCDQIDISFSADDGTLAVHVRYRASDGGPAPVAATDVQGALAEIRDGHVPLDVIRQAMPDVEFGRDGAVEYCRLSRKLPGAS
ncbi:MAG TPA: hypothetical protein DCP38_09330 [Acidobacteria bacterium]|nr:hypothetical protein [Acidobacteriota bacterium]|tara:strand:+ start:2817 stop:3263 length:447 start_codon:yes stop_codon:yes gene_type:complete